MPTELPGSTGCWCLGTVFVCFLPIHSGHQWTYQPGSHRRIYSILEQRVNKLNTFVLQALDSQIRYNTVQVKTHFSGFEPYEFGPRRGRIAVRSVLKWRHPQLLSALHRAYKVMNEPQARMALPTGYFCTFVASVHV